jgi:hypothetical protein
VVTTEVLVVVVWVERRATVGEVVMMRIIHQKDRDRDRDRDRVGITTEVVMEGAITMTTTTALLIATTMKIMSTVGMTIVHIIVIIKIIHITMTMAVVMGMVRMLPIFHDPGIVAMETAIPGCFGMLEILSWVHRRRSLCGSSWTPCGSS